MAYLFGDLTPAPFDTNILEEIRDAIDFSAALADADQCVVSADGRREELRRRTEAEVARIDALVRALDAAVDAADKGDDGSVLSSFVVGLAKSISERRNAADVDLRRKLEADNRVLEAEMLAARADYFPMLERYLLLRSPPTAAETVRIELVGSRKEERQYTAEIVARSELGLDWNIELALPTDGVWSEPLRVEDVVEYLAITAPHLSGLIKKEVKPKTTKIGRHFVTQLVDDGATVRIEVRDEIGKPDGFDITADLARRVVMVAKTGEEDDITLGAFTVTEEDEAPLLALAEKLRAPARALRKKRLASAMFDGRPFDGENTDAQPKLVGLVSRIAEKLGPAVDEIAARSKSDEELVLRRVLDDGKREELFMPKTRLREQLEGLDDAHVELFAPVASALEISEVAEATTIDVEEPTSAVRAEVPPAVQPYVRRDSNKQFAAVKITKPPVRVLEITPDSLPEPVKAEPVVEEVALPSAPAADLKTSLKQALSLTKEGKLDEAFRQYAALFGSPGFIAARPDDQRQALRLMIFSKAAANPTNEVLEAHRAAIPAIQALVVKERNAADYEMLGMVYVALDEPAKATEIYKKGLEIERAKSPGSDLCGDLMRRVSQL